MRINTAEEMLELGRALANELKAGDLVILDGPLGAGKTTLTRGIGEGLHVRGPVTSPTFVVSRIHPSLVGGPSLVHVDAYRLNSSAEIEDLDLDSEISRAVTIVEWGAGRVEGLSVDPLIVSITRDDVSDIREVNFSGGPRWSRLLNHGVD